jgi:hypothetical protein
MQQFPIVQQPDDIQNYCFPMFTDFITGHFALHKRNHSHLAIKFRKSLAKRTPRRTAELLVTPSYNTGAPLVKGIWRKIVVPELGLWRPGFVGGRDCMVGLEGSIVFRFPGSPPRICCGIAAV